MNFFDTILSLLMAICTLFTGFMDYGTPTVTSGLELVKEEQFELTEVAFAGQGIATDGEYYYASGSLTAFGVAGLIKCDAETMECVARNADAIPEVYKNNFETDHIGGISYYNGLIYAAVENHAEDFNLVMTYDADTLELVEVYNMPNELLPDGIPWCCVDSKNGYLYCSQFNNVNEILAFDIETMELSHIIPLSEEVVRIQGGEAYDDVLYLSSDIKNSNDDKILTVDVNSGEVKELCTRSLPSLAGNEAEGLTVYPMEDGTFIHVLDYDKTIGVYLRHYKMAE
jgi:hypothetical protein